MKFPFPFKSSDVPTTSWPWPPICATNPRTLSFRTTITPPHDFANATPEESAVISGLRSDRLFFEPGATSSILDEAKARRDDNATMVVIESRNPFLDFRVSMGEMVEAHGVRDWEFLQDLLDRYLRANDETNHGCIVGAFVDLLIHLLTPQSSSPSSSSSSLTSYSFTSPLSFSSSMDNSDEVFVHKNG